MLINCCLPFSTLNLAVHISNVSASSHWSVERAKAPPYAVKACLQLGISLSHPLLRLLVLNEENPAGLDLHFCSDGSCFGKCIFSCPCAATCWWPKICCPTEDLWQVYSVHTRGCLWREASMKKAGFILQTAGLTIRYPQTVFSSSVPNWRWIWEGVLSFIGWCESAAWKRSLFQAVVQVAILKSLIAL